MLWIICAAFGVACVACVLRVAFVTEEKKSVRTLFAVGAVVLLALTAVSGMLAGGHNVAGIGGGYPVEAADGFFCALEAGDFETAETYVEFGRDLGLEDVPEEDGARLVHQALTER